MKGIKIKEDIELKELKRYGFKERKIMKDYKYRGENMGIYVNKKDRRVCISNFIECDMYDIGVLYEMFKAGIIEEVEIFTKKG